MAYSFRGQDPLVHTGYAGLARLAGDLHGTVREHYARALRAMGLELGALPPAKHADLEQAFAASDAPLAPFVVEDLRTFGDHVVATGLRFHVERAQIDADGCVEVQVSLSHLSGEVRPGDMHLAGAGLVGDPSSGRVWVEPRLVRVVCRNRAVVPMCVAGEESLYVRRGADTEGSLVEAVRAGFSQRAVDRSVEALRRMDQRRAGPRYPGGGTVYDVWNHLTRTARDETAILRRHRLETEAGGWIPAFLDAPSPAPAVHAAATLAARR